MNAKKLMDKFLYVLPTAKITVLRYTLCFAYSGTPPFKVSFQKPQEALNLLSIFYMPLDKFIHNLLNVLEQNANKSSLVLYPSSVNA
jgi:hypothetical protein